MLSHCEKMLYVEKKIVIFAKFAIMKETKGECTMLSVGMIGAGSIAPYHLAALDAHPDTKLCAVADLNATRSKEAAEPYGAAAYTDYLEMLDREKPDAVIINLPHGLHEECAIACAQRGIHMLLEKPMSVSGQSCRRINEACRKTGTLLQIGHVQRYDPSNQGAKALIESGELGRIVMINDQRTTNYFSDDRPRWFLKKDLAGGGIWINYGAHAIDKLCYLTDSRVASITGSCTYPDEFDVDGSAQAMIRMENGISATVSICGYAVVPMHETMIYMTKGSIRLRPFSSLWVCREGDKEYQRVDTGTYPKAFFAQWNDFVAGIQQGRILHCDGEYGTHIMEQIEQLWE